MPTFWNTVPSSQAGRCEEFEENSSHPPAYEDGTDRVFWNISI